MNSVWIGFDPREVDAFAVARDSLRQTSGLTGRGVVLQTLIQQGLYFRPTERRDGRLFDVISDHPMATEFAISRFLVPTLVRRNTMRTDRPRLALFMDSDVLVHRSIERVFEMMKPEYAVMVVKHDFQPAEGTKMDGQVQTRYRRKNWSSVMLFNVDHPANDRLTVDLVNRVPGRDLHAFCWLKDEEIGELPVEYNYLVGHHTSLNPRIVHFTDGVPSMAGYEECEYADEWKSALFRWASRG